MPDNECNEMMQRNHPRRSELAIFALLAVIGLTALGVLSLVDPSANPYLPKCPLHLLTGLHCPGCGATRATCCLLHGQLSAAFRYNPLFVAVLPMVLLLIGKRLYELIFETTITLPLTLRLYFYRLIAIAVCVFFVLRNIPLDCFGILRPPMG